MAAQANIQGTVRMKAVILKDGSVDHLEAVSGHPLLLPAALDSVKQWRYRPTLQNGEPVEVATTIDLHFRLESDAAPAPASAAAKSAPAPANAQPTAAAASSSTRAPASSTSAATPAKAEPAPAPAKVESAPPANSAASGPPSLYSEESKATLRILAPGLPRDVEMRVLMGDEQIYQRLPAAGEGTRDATTDRRVLPGQRTFRVIMKLSGSSAESSKTARGELKPRGSHILEVEIRGLDDNGLPRFNVKLK